MKKIINKIDWILFSILLFSAFTPLLYKFYRTFLVSSNLNDSLGFAVNWGYINMIFETINIFVVVPAYWFIKRNATNQVEINRNMIIAILFAFISFVSFFVLIVSFGAPMANSSINDWYNTNEAIETDWTPTFGEIYSYIITYGFSLSLHLFFNLFIVYIIIHNKKFFAFLLTLTSLVTIMLFDTLFLNSYINKNIKLISISCSMLISSLVILFISGLFVYLHDRKSWNDSFKLLKTNEILSDFKIYSKNGIFLSLEAIVWNVLNVLGVTIWLTNQDIEIAFWTMDGIFWGFLLLPATAVSMFAAEGISNEENPIGKHDVMKVSFLLSGLTICSWFIMAPLLVIFAIPFALNDQSIEIIESSQKMCWIIVLLIAFQVPTRSLYTYFATTNRSIYLLVGTSIGATIVWGVSLLVFLTGVEMDNPELWIPLIYGFGIVVIFIVYSLIYWWTYQDEEDTPGLMKRLKEKMFVASKLK